MLASHPGTCHENYYALIILLENVRGSDEKNYETKYSSIDWHQPKSYMANFS